MTEDEIKSHVDYALGKMCEPDASIETAVRWVLRIATVKGHDGWRIWALMHLSDNSQGGTPEEAQLTHRILFDLHPSPDEHEQRERLVSRVINSVSRSRRIDENRDLIVSVADLERRAAEIALLSPRERSAEEDADYWTIRRTLTRIKNKAQIYLMCIEAGLPADAGADDPEEPGES